MSGCILLGSLRSLLGRRNMPALGLQGKGLTEKTEKGRFSRILGADNENAKTKEKMSAWTRRTIVAQKRSE